MAAAMDMAAECLNTVGLPGLPDSPGEAMTRSSGLVMESSHCGSLTEPHNSLRGGIAIN